MKLVKRLSILILIILLGNLLTWFFYGQNRVLILGSEASEVLDWVQSPDTLIIFTGRIEDMKRYSQVADFTDQSLQNLKNRLQSKTQLTVLTDKRPIPIGNGDGDDLLMQNALAYYVYVDRRFPFYAEVGRSLYAPGFVVVVESRNIWFFRWWEIDDRMTGIS